MKDCPECDPLYNEWLRLQGIAGSLTAALTEIQRDRVKAINHAVRGVNFANRSLSIATANLVGADGYASATAAAAAEGGGHQDLSSTPRDGWLEIDVGNGVTVWAKNEAALEFLGGFLGAGAAAAVAADAQAMLEQRRADYDLCVSRLEVAERRLRNTTAKWDAKVAAAEEAIPPAEQAAAAARAAYDACIGGCGKSAKRDVIAAAVGAAMLVGGLFALAGSETDAVVGTAGALAGEAGPEFALASSPFDAEVMVDDAGAAPNSAEAPVGEDPATGGDQLEAAVGPGVLSSCNGTDHYPDVPATDADGKTTSSPSKQVIGAFFIGLPPGTRIMMETAGAGSTVGVVNDDGYAEFQLPLYDYGVYEITSVTATAAGKIISFDPIAFGSPFTVAGSEYDCGRGVLPAPVTSTTSSTTTSSTTTTTTLASGTGATPTPVPAGGGAVPFPPVITGGGSGGVLITPGSAETPGSELDLRASLFAAALVVAGSATLGGLASPTGSASPGTSREGDTTTVGEPDSEGDPPGQEMDMSTGTPVPVGPTPDWMDKDFPSSATAPTTLATNPGPTDASTLPPQQPGQAEGTAPSGSEPTTPSGQSNEPPTAPASPPPPTEPTIRFETGGNGGDSINAHQPFSIVAEFPRTSAVPAKTIDVVIKSSSGAEQTVTLRWNQSAKGNLVYSTNTMTLERGGEGAGSVTVLGLEFSAGGLDRFDIDNGDTVTVSHGELTTQISAYESWIQQGIARSVAVIEAQRQHWQTVADLLAIQEQTPGIIAFRNSLVPVMERAARAHRMLHSEKHGDTAKLAYLSTYARYMEPQYDEYAAESEIRRIAERKREDYGNTTLTSGVGNVALGLYRAIVEASPAASAYRLASGDDITGTKLSTAARILAAVELAGWVSTAGGGEARSIADLLTGAGSRKYVNLAEGMLDTEFTKTGIRPTKLPGAPRPLPPSLGTIPPVRVASTRKVLADGARLPEPSLLRPVPNRPGAIPDVPVDTSILTARAGTKVLDPKAFGMTPEAFFQFQSVARRWGLIIRVRAANLASVRWLYRGHPPKHVKLKSKSIKPIDYHLGAKEGTEGLVGYFKPSLPKNIDSLEPGLASAIRKRFKQRLLEYADNAPDMTALERKGLIRLDDGVVVDTGLSSTRLKGDSLVPTPGAPVGGTGKGVTGDYDQYSQADALGSPITANHRMAAAQSELAGGHANTQHGCHLDWVPANTRDQGIFDAIRRGHRGTRLTDGGIGPMRQVTNGRENVAEGLLEFGRAEGPVVAYDTAPIGS